MSKWQATSSQDYTSHKCNLTWTDILWVTNLVTWHSRTTLKGVWLKLLKTVLIRWNSNSGRKIECKNWISRWKNYRPGNWCEKLKISGKILKFLQSCPKLVESLKYFSEIVTTGITWHNEAHWHISSYNWTWQFGDLSLAVWVWHTIWVPQLHSLQVSEWLETRVSAILVSLCQYSLTVHTTTTMTRFGNVECKLTTIRRVDGSSWRVELLDMSNVENSFSRW